MDNLLGIDFDIETMVAYLFGLTAIVTIAMTTWAYIYQRRRELSKAQTKSSQIGDQGQYFVRVRPS